MIWYAGSNESVQLVESRERSIYAFTKRCLVWGANPLPRRGTVALRETRRYLTSTELLIRKVRAAGWEEDVAGQAVAREQEDDESMIGLQSHIGRCRSGNRG